jgi:hypothetical protein
MKNKIALMLLLSPAYLMGTYSDEINQFAASSHIMRHSQQDYVQTVASQSELSNFLTALDSLTAEISDWTTHQVSPDSTNGFWKYTVNFNDSESLTIGLEFTPPLGIQDFVTQDGSRVILALQSDLTQTDPVPDQGYPNWRVMNQLLNGGILMIVVPEGQTFLDIGADASTLGIGFRQLLQLMNWSDPDGDQVNSPDSDCLVNIYQCNPWLNDQNNQFYWAFSGGSPDDQVWTLDRSLNFIGCKHVLTSSGETVFYFNWMML